MNSPTMERRGAWALGERTKALKCEVVYRQPRPPAWKGPWRQHHPRAASH
jgi:hypothetical protein